jgi:hypothetical protein
LEILRQLLDKNENPRSSDPPKGGAPSINLTPTAELAGLVVNADEWKLDTQHHSIKTNTVCYDKTIARFSPV